MERLGNMGTGNRPATLVGQDHFGVSGAASAERSMFSADRVPWRWVGARTASVGASATIGVLRPALGEIVALVAMSVALAVIGTAVFGSPELSGRAFRLMRWVRNRPEPRSPGTQDRAIPPAAQYAECGGEE